MVRVGTQKCKTAPIAHLMALVPRRLRRHLRSLKCSTVIQAKVRNSGKPFSLAAALTISVLDAI
jgi:hypothetical protein